MSPAILPATEQEVVTSAFLFAVHTSLERVFENLRFIGKHVRFRSFQCGRSTETHKTYVFSNKNASVRTGPM